MEYSKRINPCKNSIGEICNKFIVLIIISVFSAGISSAQSAPFLDNSAIGISGGSVLAFGGEGVTFGGTYKLWLSPYHYAGLEYANIKFLRNYNDYPSGYEIDKYHLLLGLVLRNKSFIAPYTVLSMGKSRELSNDNGKDDMKNIWPTTYSIRYGILFNIFRFNLGVELENGNLRSFHWGTNMVLSYRFKKTPKVDPYDHFRVYTGRVYAVSRSNSPVLEENTGQYKEYFFEVEKNNKVFEWFITKNKITISKDIADSVNISNVNISSANVGFGRVVSIIKLPYVQFSGILGIQFKYLEFITSPGVYGGINIETKIWRILPFIRYRYMYNQHLKYDYINLKYYTQSLSLGVGFDF